MITVTPMVSGRVYRSQNLRGILAHAKRAKPLCVITQRDPNCEHRGQYRPGAGGPEMTPNAWAIYRCAEKRLGLTS